MNYQKLPLIKKKKPQLKIDVHAGVNEDHEDGSWYRLEPPPLQDYRTKIQNQNKSNQVFQFFDKWNVKVMKQLERLEDDIERIEKELLVAIDAFIHTNSDPRHWLKWKKYYKSKETELEAWYHHRLPWDYFLDQYQSETRKYILHVKYRFHISFELVHVLINI